MFTPKLYGHWLEYAIAFFAAFVGAIIEMLSTKLRLDDNLAVPTVIGLTLWVGYWVLSQLHPLYVDALARLSP